MSVSHLAKVGPSQLGFVRAFLWQLARTGQLADSAAEQQAAVVCAQAIASVARNRDQLNQLFGEFRQYVESGNESALSESLRAALEQAVGPVAANPAASEPAPAPVVEPKVVEPKAVEPKAVEPKAVEPKAVESKAAVSKASVSKASVSKASVSKAVAPKAVVVAPTKVDAEPKADPAAVADNNVDAARLSPRDVTAESASLDDAPIATAGDTPDDEGEGATDGSAAHVIHGSDSAHETSHDA